MTKNIDLPPPLARIKDDVADAELDKVSGGDENGAAQPFRLGNRGHQVDRHRFP